VSGPDVVSVVAGGWSVSEVDLGRLPGLVVGVNEAAVLVPLADVAVSMDRLWAEHRWQRLVAARNVPAWPALLRFTCDHTSTRLASEPGVLNGTNSGLCAVNLAYQLRPATLVLWGFDLQRGPRGEPYWYPPYEWANPAKASSPGRLKAWAREYGVAAEQLRDAGVEVLNASPRSLLDQFRRVRPEEVYA
jgi:hypothetical protein